MKIVGLTKKESQYYNDLYETTLGNCSKKMMKRFLKLRKKIIKVFDERCR